MCFGRLFVAKCMRCDGKGYVEEPVAGAAAGTMKASCSPCGGTGVFAVNRPNDWVDPEPVGKKLETATA
jgi:DnaJ-class molecular chaperone